MVSSGSSLESFADNPIWEENINYYINHLYRNGKYTWTKVNIRDGSLTQWDQKQSIKKEKSNEIRWQVHLKPHAGEIVF